MICQGSSFPWRNRLASSGDPPDSDMVGGNPRTSKKYLLFLKSAIEISIYLDLLFIYLHTNDSIIMPLVALHPCFIALPR